MTGRPDRAARVWAMMRSLVLDQHDRREEVAEQLQMSFVRAKALRRLSSGPLTMRELAAAIATDPPYATLIVDDLQRRGLVARTTHPEDRRAKVVSLTPAGEDVAARADEILNEPPAPLRALPPADLAALERILALLGG